MWRETRGGDEVGKAAEARDEKASISVCGITAAITVAVQRSPPCQHSGEGGGHAGTKLDKGKAREHGPERGCATWQEHERLLGIAGRVVGEEVPTFHAKAQGEDDRLQKPKPNSALRK